MSFFDSNQEVIDIQLTSFGKHQMSKGRLKPAYYSFFDDEVLYSADYASFSEATKDAQDRIMDNTPSLKVQSSVESIDEIIKRRQKLIQDAISDSVFNASSAKEANYVNLNLETEIPNWSHHPIGTSIAMSSSAPAWNVQCLQGEISSVASSFTPTDEQSRNLAAVEVPYIQMSSSFYNVSVQRQTSQLATQPKERINLQDSERPPLLSKTFSDSEYISISENAIILVIDEENTDYSNESIEVEIYEVTDTGEKRLTFIKDQSNNIDEDGFLTETDETSRIKPNNTNVEYYFDIKTDHRIGIPRLSSLLPVDKFGNVIFDDPVIDFETRIQRRNLLIPSGDGVVRIDREDC